ncbi:hypothetical protein TURU_136078 [Turdus rufiventris]|nr:hypothetical protein TURU_136078 [Turdus rufiventris]
MTVEGEHLACVELPEFQQAQTALEGDTWFVASWLVVGEGAEEKRRSSSVIEEEDLEFSEMAFIKAS